MKKSKYTDVGRMGAGHRLREARERLADVATQIGQLLEKHKDGRFGYITKEWGFMTPGGLSVPIGGKFRPWEEALAKARIFFPDASAYEVLESSPTAMSLPPKAIHPQQHEMLIGNSHLHEFLRTPPTPTPVLAPQDIREYRDASRLFILVGSLAHLASNSSPNREPVPEWIASPLLALAQRLDVEPALSGHFMNVDNWRWRGSPGSRDFCLEQIDLLYAAFGHSHERTYHTVPACMAYALRGLPYALHELICGMREYADERLAKRPGSEARKQLLTLIHEIATMLTRSKDEFQRISTNPSHRTYVSKHVFIRHMQPFHKGIVLENDDGVVRTTKGMSGLHFVSYHLLDAVLGRYQFGQLGELARMEEVDKYYPRPQRDYSACVARLSPDSTLRGFIELVEPDAGLLRAFNQLVECYAGESGVLAAHSRKLFSYMHNNLQVDTSAEGASAKPHTPPTPDANHVTALRMFGVINEAVRERRRLRKAPLYALVTKTVAYRNGGGSFAVVEFTSADDFLRYQGSDVVRVLLPRDDVSADEIRRRYFAGVERISAQQLTSSDGFGWRWSDLWEALGWPTAGVPPNLLCKFIEEVYQPGEPSQPVFRPVSPRVYSVCGTQPGALRVLISRPRDDRAHFGFSRMVDDQLSEVFIAIASGRRFRVPAEGSNLVIVAGGTGISPFVSLVREIGARRGRFTLIHQTSVPEAFLYNLDVWKEFTAVNPLAWIIGYLSRSGTGNQEPERVVVSGGQITERVRLHTETEAYFFLSGMVLERLRSVAQPSDNLAYCCGGVNSTLLPLRSLLSEQGWKFEFDVQTYGIDPKISARARLFRTASKLINATQIGESHPGGGRIIDQMIGLGAPQDSLVGSIVPPDLSSLFLELHPDATNLLRLINTPTDDEFQSFASTLEREAARGIVLDQVAEQYVAAALSFADKLNVLKVALRLQSTALDRHLDAIGGGASPADHGTAETIAAASGCLRNLEELLPCLAADAPERGSYADKIARARAILSSPAYVFDARTGASVVGASESHEFGCKEYTVGDVMIFRLHGRLDTTTSHMLEAGWQARRHEGIRRFVLDMDGLTYISSMGLRCLILMAKSSKLVLCGLSPFVAKMIDLGGISRVIRIKQDVREAIEAVSSDT